MWAQFRSPAPSSWYQRLERGSPTVARLLRTIRDLYASEGFSTRYQLNAASGSVAAAAMIAKTNGFRNASPQMISNCCIGQA